MLKREVIQRLGALLLLMFVAVMAAANPHSGFKVSTDKLDYAPGSTAIITGLGWSPNTAVTLQIVHVDGRSNASRGHQSFQVRTDAKGDFTANWYVDPADSLGASFLLTADQSEKGQTTHHTEWRFTDRSNTTTTITSDINPSTYGTLVTFSITVAGSTNPNPTGTVDINDGSNTIATVNLTPSGSRNAVATYTSSTLSVGSHSITANYGGDSNFRSSTSSTLHQTVNQANTSTALTSSQNPSISGASVTFTATVTGSAGGSNPTGNVTFKDGFTTLGTTSVNGSGVATFSTASLSIGSHNIKATYNGDSNYNGSTSSTLTQVVNAGITTTTTVASSQNPANEGTSVTFTATVTGGATPTGTVTFKDGGTTIGSGALNGSGVASASTSSLTAGTHSITAIYGGDGTHNTSTSSALSQVIIGNTTTTVSSNANPSVLGQSVTLTATISVSAGFTSGTVTFKDGSTTLGTGSVGGNSASYTTSALTIGTHTITAVYGGDSNYNGSTSANFSQVVNKGGSHTNVVSSLNPAYPGQSVTLTATVSAVAPTSGTPTGTVTFKDGGATIGTGSLSGGAASMSTSSLTVGSHNITASYGGDSTFTSSTSSTLTQTINSSSTNLSLSSSSNPANYQSSVTFTSKLTNSGGSGISGATITFLDGASVLGTGVTSGSGNATFTTSTLSTGSHNITSSFAGNLPTQAASTSSVLTQTINKQTIEIVISNTTQAYDGTPKSVTCTTVPSGLEVDVTYNFSPTVPSAVGTYFVIATLNDPNYSGTNFGFLTITKGVATLTLSGLNTVYNGSPQGVTVTTAPSGLSGVSVTYNGSTTQPTNAGSYAVVASLTNANYAASNATGTFVIAKADQAITFNPLPDKHFGDPAEILSASSTSGLPVSFAATAPATISGSSMSFPANGPTTVAVTVTASQVGDANHNAAPNVTQSFQLISNAVPTSVAVVSPTPNAAGWNNSPVTVAITATDPSGPGGVKEIHYTLDGGTETIVPGATASVSLSTDGVHSLVFHAVNTSGNAESPQTLPIKLDQVAPTLTANPSRQPDSNGWYTSPVDITFTADDGSGSGVDSTTLTPPIHFTGPDSKTASVAADVSDIAGNPAHTVFNFKYDATAPVILVTGLSGAAHENVVFDVSASDSGSGANITLQTSLKKDGVVIWTWTGTAVAPAAPEQTIAGQASDGLYHLDVTATDEAGNVSTQAYDFAIDNEAPEIQYLAGSPADGGAYNTPQTVSYTITDDFDTITSIVQTLLTQIASVDIGPVALVSGTMVSQEGSYTVHLAATDSLGHTGQLDRTFMIDMTPPVLNDPQLSGTFAPNPTWFASDVNVTLSATDPQIRTTPTPINGSGVQSIQYYATGAQPMGSSGSPIVVSGASAAFTINTEGVTTITYWAVDAAGNSAQPNSVTVQYDKTAPTFPAMSDITVTATKPTGADVSFTLPTPTDNLDPNPTIIASPASGSTFGVGTTTVTVTATDAAGNTFSRTFNVTVNNPSATLASISPDTKTYGDAAFTMTVTGTQFMPGSIVKVDGAPRPTTFLSQTGLQVSIPAGDMLSAGTRTITVFSPAPGGGTTTGLPMTVNKAAPTLTLTGGSFAYDGNPHPAVATLTGVLGETLSPVALTYSPGGASAPVNLGTYQVTGSFAGNGNYNSVSATTSIDITTSAAVLTLSNLNQTYTGNGIAATVTTNPPGLGVVAVTYNGSSTLPVHAGSYAVVATLTNSSYSSPPVSGTLVIGKANAILTVPSVTATFDRIVHGTTGTATGLKGENLGALTITYVPGGTTTPVNAGVYTANGAFAGAADYNAGTGVGTVTINKGSQTVTFTDPGPQTFGGAPVTLSAKSTNGLPITFVVAAGQGSVTGNVLTITGAGSIVIAATQEGNNNWIPATTSVAIAVAKATPTVSVTGGTYTYDGNAHPATGSVTGVAGANLGSPTFTYSPGGTSAPVIGGTYSVTGTFSGNSDYNAASGTGSITINGAVAALNITNLSQTYTGNPDPVTVTTQPAGLSGVSVTYNGSTTPPTHAGSYTVVATLNNIGFTAPPVTKTLVIAPANASLTVVPLTVAYNGAGQGTTGTAVGVKGESLGALAISYNTPGGLAPVHVGSWLATGTFAGTPDYNPGTASATITIGTRLITVTADNLTKFVNANNPTLTGTISGVVPGDGITAAFTMNGQKALGAGTYTIFAGVNDPNGKIHNYAVQLNNGTLTTVYNGNSGILSPIKADGSSVFFKGVTIPIMFNAYDVNKAPVSYYGVEVSMTLDQTIAGAGTINSAGTSAAPTSTFVFDGTEWVMNLSTVGMAGNTTYVYHILLNDGSTISFKFGLN